MNQELLVINNVARISSFIYKDEAGNGFCPPVPVWPKTQCTPTVFYKPHTWTKCLLTINPAGHWRANFCLLLLSFPFSFPRSILARKGIYIYIQYHNYLNYIKILFASIFFLKNSFFQHPYDQLSFDVITLNYQITFHSQGWMTFNLFYFISKFYFMSIIHASWINSLCGSNNS